MKDHTKQLVKNMIEGKRVADALRDATPGVGRYKGVTQDDVDDLARTYVDLSIRHAELLQYGRTASRGIPKTIGGLALRASYMLGVFAAYRRGGPRAAAAVVLVHGALQEATHGYLGSR